MIALGLVLIVVGFFLLAVRTGDVTARNSRNVSIGRLWTSVPARPDRGYDMMPSRRNRVIRALVGLVMVVVGFVIIAVSS